MNAILRSLVALAVAGVIVVTAVSCPPFQLADLDLLSATQELASCRAQREKLDAIDERVVARIEEKTRLAEEVAAGRMTLREAASRCAALNRDNPSLRPDIWRTAYPGATEEERHCREVLAYVRSVVQDDPAGVSVVARLEAELRKIGAEGKQ